MKPALHFISLNESCFQVGMIVNSSKFLPAEACLANNRT